MEWLVIEEDQHVLNWLDNVEPPPTRNLCKYLSFIDNIPANLPVFTGVIRVSLDRYRAMADHTWCIACPAAIFRADTVENVSYDKAQPAAEVAVPLPLSSIIPVQSSNSLSTLGSSISTNRNSASTSGSSSSTNQDQSRGSGKWKAQPDPPRNKFIPVNSPIMPTSIHSWVTASCTIGKFFNNSQPQHRGVSRDYVLPEPALFANHMVESSHQAFLKMYLKVHEVLLYNIAACGPLACLRSPKDWHRMLGLELFGQKDTDGWESHKWKKLRADLQSAASSSSGSDVSIVSAPVPSGLNVVLIFNDNDRTLTFPNST